ncbi:MAG: hypothetical protein NC115_08050 [Bacteroidales bacterium]|nr:hypothetical protein [Bacteroidales bacterium]
MKSRQATIATAIAIMMAMACLSCTSFDDPYLKTLRHLNVEMLEPFDSVDVDNYAVFHLDNVVPVDDEWFLMSSNKGEYNLMFLNAITSECFSAIRRGRGPGEIVQGSNLYKAGNSATYYDYNGGICVCINLAKTIEYHYPVMDTIGIFRDKVPRPVYIGMCGKDRFVSGNSADDEVWYSLFDSSGNVMSNIEAWNYKDLTKDRDRRLSWMLSSKYAANSDGTRICVANVASPTLSFASVEDGMMAEYMRYEVAPPKYGTADMTGAFHGLFADDIYVYILYSGHKLSGDLLPSHECNHLVIYSWEGMPIRHYYLSRNISSICIDGNCLIGSSDYPECKVYKYLLPGL